MSKVFLNVLTDIYYLGKTISPRGMQVIELEDYQFTLQPRERFVAIKARNLNLDYIKEEFLWYLRADPKDSLIAEAAQIWRDLAQPDGTYLSNYGVYWFNYGGFWWVIHCLKKDPDSRQAVIPMLRAEHLYEGNKDVVCTYSIGFRIRRGQLNMSVNMRSQDAIWGMANDIPCFSFLHEMVYVYLRSTYPELKLGKYVHKVDSLHVYERHFKMLENIVIDGYKGLYEIECPEISSPEEVEFLINRVHIPNHSIPPTYNFSRWLLDNKYRGI